MAEELSKLTGESIKTGVTIALPERLARVRQEQGLSLADRLLAIGRDCATRPTRHPARWITIERRALSRRKFAIRAFHRSE